MGNEVYGVKDPLEVSVLSDGIEQP